MKLEKFLGSSLVKGKVNPTFKIGSEDDVISKFSIYISQYLPNEEIRLSIRIDESEPLPNKVYEHLSKKVFDDVNETYEYGCEKCKEINRFFKDFLKS